MENSGYGRDKKKKNVKYGTEFFGINRAFKSIDRSDVCVLVIDLSLIHI